MHGSREEDLSEMGGGLGARNFLKLFSCIVKLPLIGLGQPKPLCV